MELSPDEEAALDSWILSGLKDSAGEEAEGPLTDQIGN